MTRTASTHARRLPAATAALALITALAVVLAPLAVTPAHAQSPRDEAREHFQRGQSLYQAGQYRDAIAAFAQANAIAPSPVLEFNIGLCHDRLGERAEAVRRYRAYLEQLPNAANREAVEAKLAQLERELAAADEARRAAEAAEAAAAEAARAAAQPPPAAAEEPPAPAPAPEPPAAYAPPPARSTGDPELDRAAAIDIQAVREGFRGPAPAPSPAPPEARTAPAGPPPPVASATSPRPDAGAPAPAPRATADKRRDDPIYKQWWFWVFVGAGAIILAGIVNGDSSSTDRTVRGLESPTGPVLLRF